MWPEVSEHVAEVHGYPVEKTSIWSMCVDFEQVEPDTCSGVEAFRQLSAKQHVPMDIEISGLTEDDMYPYVFEVNVPSENITFAFDSWIRTHIREHELLPNGVAVFTLDKK